LWAVQPEEAPSASIRQKPGISAAPSPILIVSGSNTDTTRQQILRLIENYAYYGQGSNLEIFDLPPDQLLGLASLDSTIERILEALSERNTVVLSSTLKEETYQRTMALASEHNIPEDRATRSAQGVLARITDAVLKRKATKLVLIGGETTCEVCDVLGNRELQVIAEADISIPLTMDSQGRWIVTKSGGFGSPMALANVIKFIKQHETASVHA
jgi:uncharacterized protein YgbK (DUF1537 family)